MILNVPKERSPKLGRHRHYKTRRLFQCFVLVTSHPYLAFAVDDGSENAVCPIFRSHSGPSSGWLLLRYLITDGPVLVADCGDALPTNACLVSLKLRRHCSLCPVINYSEVFQQPEEAQFEAPEI